MTPEELYREIAASAAQLTGRDTKDLTPAMCLHGDLGIDGDDASAFMSAFARRYDVDLSQLRWARYFDDEGWDLLQPLLVAAMSVANPRFAARWRAAVEAEREITLNHLVLVARTREWSDPVSARRRKQPGRLAQALSILAALPVLVLGGVGALACFGYFTGRLGQTNLATALVMIALAVTPLLLAWGSWRNVQRKLASA
jgi:hypothetical protein